MSAVNSGARPVRPLLQGRRAPAVAETSSWLHRAKKNRKFIFAGLVVVLAVAYLIFNAVQGTTMYYLTVSEIKDRGQMMYNEPVRLGGKVVDGTIDFNRDTRALRFTVTDGKETMPVVYSGVVPDAFKPDADVILEGKYSGSAFEAKVLLAKCPSKYVPADS